MQSPSNLGSTCMEFRNTLNRDFVTDNDDFPFVSLTNSAFGAIRYNLPPTTQLTEANMLIDTLDKQHQVEKNSIRDQYEKKMHDRDQFYIHALAEITETLRTHSFAIDELRQRR